MLHTIEYDGERRTVEASRTATVLEVLEKAFPERGWHFDMSKVVCVGTGKRSAARKSESAARL